MRNARVFISCGQRSKRETSIGSSVQDFFKERGFETYYAERVRSPEALTENIFRFLASSEYFIFVDFKRDKIKNSDHRGSLFVNQELAIATFQKLPGLGFCEKGVKREGILKYQIWNAFEFEDGPQILATLKAETQDWNPKSVNELSIDYYHENVSKNIRITNDPGQPPADFYHVTIRNRHKKEHAFSCSAYLTKIIDIEKGDEREIPSNELIWSGLGDHTINIMASGTRDLDAFYVLHDENKIYFHTRSLTTTNPRYQMPILHKGKYLVEYTIVSDSFPSVSGTFLLKHEGTHEDLEFGPHGE